MSGNWYYAKNGQRFGPFTFDQFQQMAMSGMLQTNDMVLDDATGKWQSAGSVTGLFPAPVLPQVAQPSTPLDDVRFPSVTQELSRPAAEQQKSQEPSQLDGSQTSQKAPSSPPIFRLRSGGIIRNLDDLVSSCRTNWDDVEWHLGNRSLVRWLAESGRVEVVIAAETARTNGWQGKQALLHVLKSCGPSGAMLAERVEAEEEQKRQSASPPAPTSSPPVNTTPRTQSFWNSITIGIAILLGLALFRQVGCIPKDTRIPFIDSHSPPRSK
jgi:GYF domain 2